MIKQIIIFLIIYFLFTVSCDQIILKSYAGCSSQGCWKSCNYSGSNCYLLIQNYIFLQNYINCLVWIDSTVDKGIGLYKAGWCLTRPLTDNCNPYNSPKLCRRDIRCMTYCESFGRLFRRKVLTPHSVSDSYHQFGYSDIDWE